MISNTLFITYTIMCFLSLQAITLIIIIGKHRDVGKTRLLKASAVSLFWGNLPQISSSEPWTLLFFTQWGTVGSS